MEEPDPDLTATAEEQVDPPEFDALTPPAELVRGERTRDDFFDAVLGLDSPATAGDVAERADHGVDAAREYLEWFERLGIVTQVTETPATYKRNQAYLNWRRIQQLRDNYSTDELITFLETETRRADVLASKFDADTPDAVSISEHAANSGQSVDEVWDDVVAWQTARQRITLLERGLQTGSGDAADNRPVV